MLICPNCQKHLFISENQYRCEQGHTFDCGRSGEVNLLLPQQKRSKFPGDSKAMVAARRDFLASGVYQPIAERLAKTVMMLSSGQGTVIADAGCGEGYYLRQIQRLCYPNDLAFQAQGGAFIGWDISKFAAQSAAKQADFAATWVCAGNAAIPLNRASVDILLSAFGFAVPDEFARVVKSGGFIVVLNVGEQHLIELRQIIYETLKPYQFTPTLESDKLKCLKTDRLSYQIELNQSQIQQLLTMTPHLYRAGYQGKKRIQAYRSLSITIDVVLTIYQRLPSGDSVDND